MGLRLSVLVLCALATACTPVPSLPEPPPTHPASPEAREVPASPRIGVLALGDASATHLDPAGQPAEGEPTKTQEKPAGHEGHGGQSDHEGHDEHGGHRR